MKYQRITFRDDIEISEKEKLNMELDLAKKEIAKYDYIGIKIATGVATIEDYQEEITYMESIRKVINEIQQDIDNL